MSRACPRGTVVWQGGDQGLDGKDRASGHWDEEEGEEEGESRG